MINTLQETIEDCLEIIHHCDGAAEALLNEDDKIFISEELSAIEEALRVLHTTFSKARVTFHLTSTR